MNQEDMAHLGHHEESNEGHEEEPKKRPFLYTILSIIFVMLLILSIVPIYSIKFDPMPKNIPTLSDVVTEFKEVNNSFEVKTQKELRKHIEGFKDFSSLLFERRNFQFFVNIK